MSIVERAAAKLNLALHVTGQRADGYHLLDSLVVFAQIGDEISLEQGPLSLSIEGSFAAGLSVDDNLCLDAARLAGVDARIGLTKNLPVASGIGGGSADAAAVLRGLARMGASFPQTAETFDALGADVAVCWRGTPARMRGVGEVLDDLAPLPVLHLVLVNPGVALSTPEVFGALRARDNPGLPPLPEAWDFNRLLGYLGACRNDLEPAATRLQPVIAEVLAELDRAGAALSRMSGSGATCFGIFPDRASAGLAAYRIGTARPDWWITATGLASGGGAD